MIKFARRLHRLHPIGCSLLLWLALCPGALAASDGPAQQLKLADSVKTSDHEQFTRILAELAPKEAALPDNSRCYLHYLQAWEQGYHGAYSRASQQLSEIVNSCPVRDLRFRAQVTLMNVDTLARQYGSAFQRLVKLMAIAPEIQDSVASTQFYAAAAILYNKVGEYDLATASAQHLLREGSSSAHCKGRYFTLLANYNRGRLRVDDPEIALAQHACTESNESMFANSLRILLAKLDLANGDAAAALAILTPHYEEVRKTGYAELVATFEAELAFAYWRAGDPKNAEKYAHQVVVASGDQEYSESLAKACKTLYLVNKARGNTAAALAWYEKFAAADKGFLNKVSAKSLAYQKIKQRVQATITQAEAAKKQNRILQLQQSLSAKVAETRGLYAVMLLALLILLCGWVWRLQRSQGRLRKLAEHDSLTGIFNRQYFVDAAGTMLGACKKAGTSASLILIDLDHFKLVNDTHGHATGDAVLQRTVLACQSQMRATDLFGRLGGEEFGILLANCELETGAKYAERIRSAIAALSSASDDTPDVSVSIGVASTVRASYELRQLMIHADDALYRAKRGGRNRVAVSDGTVSIVRTTFSTVG